MILLKYPQANQTTINSSIVATAFDNHEKILNDLYKSLEHYQKTKDFEAVKLSIRDNVKLLPTCWIKTYLQTWLRGEKMPESLRYDILSAFWIGLHASDADLHSQIFNHS